MLTGILKALKIILRARIEEKCHEDEEWWKDEGTHLFCVVT